MSDEILSRYTFLPWLRRGISANITAVDNLGAGASGVVERASVPVSLKVNEATVDQNVRIIGPGEIVGINRNAIVRTEPRNWVTDFEPNYLPFVEFYDEDFPWRYTPAVADSWHRLRPWIFLIVLEDQELERQPLAIGSPLPTIKLLVDPATVLPPFQQAWAWAHVHVNRDLSSGGADAPEAGAGAAAAAAVNKLDGLLRSDPDLAVSRVLSPRKLKPKTAYSAFLIPTFEIGRLAGLGEATTGVDALTPSWGGGQELRTDEYPVYHELSFTPRSGATSSTWSTFWNRGSSTSGSAYGRWTCSFPASASPASPSRPPSDSRGR